jgi:tetratricopeptide (TPR) repeat protein
MDEIKPESSQTVKSFLENLPNFLPKELLELNFGDSSTVASTLSQEGEACLRRGEVTEALNLFDQANKLDPDRAFLYYKQAMALYQYGKEKGNEKNLLLVNKKLKVATAIDSGQFDVWFLWGSALCLLGKTFQEKHFFLEADEKLKKALSLSSNQESKILADLHWTLATVTSRLAQFSNEPMDWQIATEHYQKAISFCDNFPSEFWDDYGKACLHISEFINDIRLCVKAIHFFKHSLSKCTTSFHLGWRHLSKALAHLYDYTHDEDHFTQANECFHAALQTRPDDHNLLLDHAYFLLSSGRKTKDSKRLKWAIENCHKAYALQLSSARALTLWGEALALLGEYGDRLDLLLEGQNKISQALDIGPDELSITYSHGQCLNSLGRYYNDIDYHYQAIEKFQEGLSRDRTLHTHWHAIAMSYYSVGFNLQDEEFLEKALLFFSKALELKRNDSYYLFDYALCLSRLGEVSNNQRWLELAIEQFERALSIQKNAIYQHPDWLFHFARTLDLYGDFFDDDKYYKKAIELLVHVLMIDPDFTNVHYQMGLSFSHLGELSGEIENFYKALHYFKLAAKHDDDNDVILLDQGITLINISQYTTDLVEAETSLRDAEVKLTQAAKAGNLTAYYQLACLYSLLGQYPVAMKFIEKAEGFDALPSLEEIQEDEWLDGLKNTLEWREFLLKLEKRTHHHEEEN